MVKMIRNCILAAAAAASLMFAVAPAQAGATYGSAPILQDGGYVQNASHYVLKCRIVRVRGYYGWKNVKKCSKVYPKHYSNGY
jgi:hypothetical protein